MEKALNMYLESIGITGALVAKVEAIYNFYNQYLGCKIDDIFVSEYINKDGSRVFENLWFFNSNFCYEAKQFNSQDDFDTDIIKDGITWFIIKKNDFDIIANTTTENSRMILEFGLLSGRQGDMKASKENCKQLSLIFKKFIQVNCGTKT